MWKPGLAALALSAVLWAAAEQAPAAEPFRTVGRGTVGQESAEDGSRLKWLPHRPTMPGPELGQPAPAQHQAAKPPTRLVQHSADSPFHDPFGDRRGQAEPTKPSNGGSVAPRGPDSGPADPAYPRSPAVRPQASPRSGQPLTLAEELGTQAPDLDYACPSLKELKPIGKLTYRTEPQAGEMPRDCTLDEKLFEPRQWAQTTFTWKASALCHKPLYFEDVHLERYGHSWGPLLQPVMSGAHFFGSVLALPYQAGMYPPNECMYTLGYYRPGSCAPYMLDPIPISVRGAVVAGAVWTGGIYAIP